MAKDKKEKKTKSKSALQAASVDPRLVALVGNFLKDAGLASTAKIFDAETTSKKIAAAYTAPAPASLADALKAWEEMKAVKVEEGDEGEDSGHEGDLESSDSDMDASDSDSDSGASDMDASDSDSDSSDSDKDEEMKDDSSATVSGDEVEKAKKIEQEEESKDM